MAMRQMTGAMMPHREIPQENYNAQEACAPASALEELIATVEALTESAVNTRETLHGTSLRVTGGSSFTENDGLPKETIEQSNPGSLTVLSRRLDHLGSVLADIQDLAARLDSL